MCFPLVELVLVLVVTGGLTGYCRVYKIFLINIVCDYVELRLPAAH